MSDLAPMANNLRQRALAASVRAYDAALSTELGNPSGSAMSEAGRVELSQSKPWGAAVDAVLAVRVRDVAMVAVVEAVRVWASPTRLIAELHPDIVTKPSRDLLAAIEALDDALKATP